MCPWRQNPELIPASAGRYNNISDSFFFVVILHGIIYKFNIFAPKINHDGRHARSFVVWTAPSFENPTQTTTDSFSFFAKKKLSNFAALQMSSLSSNKIHMCKEQEQWTKCVYNYVSKFSPLFYIIFNRIQSKSIIKKCLNHLPLNVNLNYT